jgi:hypothetical protein
MRLIETTHLKTWASSKPAESTFPSIVKKLICAVIQPDKLRFPSGDAVWVPSFDQIPSDLVVKSQATDIIDFILQLIRHQNGVHRSCRSRTPRGAVLSTSEVQWATTKFDGVWKFPDSTGFSGKNLTY